MSKRTKSTAPPVARPKSGLKDLSLEKKLDVTGGYLSARAESPIAAAVEPEAIALQSKRNILIEAIAAHKDAEAIALARGAAVGVASLAHDEAAADYAKAVGKKGRGDPSVLKASAVAQVSARRKHTATPAKVEGITTSRGTEPGDLDLAYPRPEGAVAFAIQYKRESALPTDPWLPADGPIQTRKVLWTITSLPVNTDIRVRIQAIGDFVGPWSDEVVGRTR